MSIRLLSHHPAVLSLIPLRSRLSISILGARPFVSQKTHRRFTPPIVRPSRCSSTLAGSRDIILRSYQEECIQAVLDHHDQGHRRLGVSLATGSGKTIIFTQLIDRLPATGRADQTLIMAHRRELVEQATRHCQSLYPNKTVEVEMSASHASGRADITVASVQSITSGTRLEKFDPAAFKLIIVDEAHHITANRYLQVLEHFGLRNKGAPGQGPLLVGVSATFARHDGIELGSCIDYIVYHKDYTDMIESQWLCDVRFTSVNFHVDLSGVQTGVNGDFNPTALSRVVNTPQANEVLVRSWLSRAYTPPFQRKSTIVFCADVSHVESLTAMFRDHGVDARYVTGNTPIRTRSDRLDAFRKGEFPVIVNCGVFTEGTDISNIDCVVLARPTRSRTLLVQMIGRGLRLHAGKKDCLILDMVASLKTGLATAPTLFGLSPDMLVENATPDELKEVKARSSPPKPEPLPVDGVAVSSVRFVEYQSLTELIEDTSEDQKIWGLSSNAWVQVGPDRYVLVSYKEGHLVIERAKPAPTEESDDSTPKSLSGEPSDTEPMFVVKFTPKLPAGAVFANHMKGNFRSSPFGRTKEIVKCPAFETAVKAADTFAGKTFEHFTIDRFQVWRQRPASKAQVEFLSKFYETGDGDGNNNDNANDDYDIANVLKPKPKKKKKRLHSNLTKGRAADLITKIKFGAKGRFDEAVAAKRRHEKAAAKADADAWLREGQSRVSVGPLHDSRPSL